jgi:methionine synthase I (cobalamin-dependent)
MGALAARPLLLDGGMGTRLIARGLDLRSDDTALWNLTHPEVVSEVHRADIAAGSDSILSNTFGANTAWLSRFGQAGEMAAINRRAVELARDAGPDRFVLGSIGPTAADRPGAYRAQADALANAGVDGLLLETHRSDRALTALRELRLALDFPILVSLFWLHEPIADAARRLVDAGADVLGVNCLRPGHALNWVAELSLNLPHRFPLLCKPSASHPDGPAVSPEELASDVRQWLDWNVRLLGGCCGATEAHVAAMRSALDEAMADGV